eukprot:gnl/MRDRNA2_/MRDRNA2_30412_c0_seq1.p1 gnl/MRDRNA2_/MRDRNA2_30412_c0~~gnl/MRDRNA2_/MRDRNA2_30412_c0_seq1.p1  ORF type:complete len:263 (-),score=23.79 gnl/MRDRNA2_/MRDRNA2_30412_c0_seq1:10-798(-)
MCCGAEPGNLYPRLRLVGMACLVNDSVAVFFYAASAMSGFAHSDHAECYQARGYDGHLVAAVCYFISCLAAMLGTVFLAQLISRKAAQQYEFSGGMGDKELRRLFWLFTAQVGWMFMSWAIEIGVRSDLPRECHEDDPYINPQLRAFIVVFYLFCYFLSAGNRITGAFYAYELHRMLKRQQNGGIVFNGSVSPGTQVVGFPLHLPDSATNPGTPAATVISPSRAAQPSPLIAHGAPVSGTSTPAITTTPASGATSEDKGEAS